MADDKKKVEEEEALQVVTDDKDTLLAQGIDAKADDKDDDEEGAAPGDKRLGGSEEEAALEERRADRRAERKQRNAKKHAREEQRLQLEKENRFLAAHNQRLERTATETAKRLDALEGTTIDGRIGQFKAALAKADKAIAEAVTEGDGDTMAEATRIRDDLKDQLGRLETAKTAAAERGETRGRREVDPRVIEKARAWASKNDWFDFERSDEDSAIAGAIDDTLLREGRLDPTTPAYWAEFDKRIAKRLPHLKKKAANGHDDDEDDDLDDDDARPGRKGAGGPKFRRGGADTPLGKNQVFLSRERLEALREAGYEEGSPEWNRMLKRYQSHDRENNAR